MMPNANFRGSQWVMFSLALVALGAFAITTDGQYSPSVFVGGVQINGVPDDWTHHHVIFNPGTEQEAIQSGHYEQWQKIVNEPRYVIQQLKKNLPVQGPAAADATYRERWISEDAGVPGPQNREPGFRFVPRYGWPAPPPRKPASTIQRDWSMTSGGTGGLYPGHYPAKYQFAATSAESCADYVVFPTGIAGSATQATLVAYNNIYKAPTCTAGTIPSILLSINTGGLADTSPVLSLDGTQVAFIQTTPAVTVTGSVTKNKTAFTVSAGTLTSSEVGAGISGTGIPAGDTIATVTSATAGTLTTEATATDGPETLTISGWAQLVLLRIGAGGGTAVGSPVSPAAVTNANYRSCTGPCYTTLSLDNDPTDTNSAPFYVYSSSSGSPDILYVGDDTGKVHEFTNVFLTGTPAEVTTNWPVTASTETTPGLDSPIYDSVSGDIFVGDASGYLHQFTPGATPSAVSTSGHLGYNTGGLNDPPIVDDTSGTDLVYQFIGYSDYTDRPSYINVFGTTGTTSIVGGSAFGTGVVFPNSTTSTRPAGTSTVMHAGTFDNVYFSGAGKTGNIYACSDGILYQIPVASIVTAIAADAAEEDTVNIYSTPTSAADLCSPVTEFYNSSTNIDYLFMSVSADGIASGGSTCTGACVLNYVAPTSPTTTTGTPTDGLAAAGGTSGIIIDNAGAGGGSEIYFTSVASETCTGAGGTGPPGNGTGSCAVQATQSGLK
jgi:hypothetical protein